MARVSDQTANTSQPRDGGDDATETELARRQPVPTAPPPASPPDDTEFSESLFTLTLEPARGLQAGGVPRPHDPLGGSALDGDALLRFRLRAVAGFLAAILGTHVAWRAVAGGSPFLALQAGIAGAIGAAYAWLAGQREVGPRALRWLEFAIFGLAAVYLATRQCQGMLHWMEAGDEASVVASVKTTLIATVLLIVAYCMMIPNTWTSAVAVTGALCVVPVVTEFLLYAIYPDAYSRARPLATLDRVGEDVALMLLAACVSVYGAHVINTLRIEAQEARQLNQYRLVKRLGTGGMGDVYLAEHQLLKRPCALKLIRPPSAADPIELARFEREVRATARLSHPNIIEVYDYGRTENNTFYYVMEFLPGLSLEELAKRHGPMPPGRLIHLLEQVCGALAEAHAMGLVHRDVKPANIFATLRGGRHDIAKLLDFGLVKGPALGERDEPNDISRAGMIRGTPLYMAPEQILPDREIDHRCDIYALGGVAYRLLTGHPVFLRDTRQEVMAAHAHEAVLPPRRRNPDIPEDLEAVVLRCLAKSPDERFPNAQALADALRGCASARDWSHEDAARWWLEHEANVRSPWSSAEPD